MPRQGWAGEPLADVANFPFYEETVWRLGELQIGNDRVPAMSPICAAGVSRRAARYQCAPRAEWRHGCFSTNHGGERYVDEPRLEVFARGGLHRFVAFPGSACLVSGGAVGRRCLDCTERERRYAGADHLRVRLRQRLGERPGTAGRALAGPGLQAIVDNSSYPGAPVAFGGQESSHLRLRHQWQLRRSDVLEVNS